MSDKVHVELVCARSQFEDTLYKSGVTWAGKGDVKTVTAEQWDKMKKHTDVWREVESVPLNSPLRKGISDAIDNIEARLMPTQEEDGDKVATTAGDKPAEPVTSDGALPSGKTADGGVSGDKPKNERPDGRFDIVTERAGRADGLGATIDVTVIDGAETDPALAEANAKIAATLADLDNMTDEAVREFAATLDVKPHHKKTGIALRGAVREALA